METIFNIYYYILVIGCGTSIVIGFSWLFITAVKIAIDYIKSEYAFHKIIKENKRKREENEK